MLTAVYATALDVAVVSVYVAGLLAMLVLSATYNLWPVSRAKWVLRRFDHSAIYLLIAATYTPFIMELKESYFAIALLIGVWCVAIVGIVLKLALSGTVRPARGRALSRDGLERRDAVRCRGEGAAGAWRCGSWSRAACCIRLGVIFHAWQRLRFQNAIWHCFVLLGAACHYTAILDLVLSELKNKL